MQNLPGDPVCRWSRGPDPIRGGYSMAIPQTSVSDSGEYSFGCMYCGIISSLTLSLLVGPPLRRLSKSHLKYIPGRRGFLPNFQCSSEGNPKPEIKWFNNLDKTGQGSHGNETSKDSERSNNTEGSKPYYKTTVMCCAINPKGEECSQLYDYDLDSSRSVDDDNEAPEITLSPGQPLLLRCRERENSTTQWLTENQEHVSVYQLSYKGIGMTYLFFESVRVNHSGIYICRSNNNKMKSTHIRVLEKGFISIDQLNESSTISAQEKPGFCLRALVSSCPLLHCHWLGPGGVQTQCPEPTRLWKNRTLELCNAEPGEYQLNLEAGVLNLTKTLSLCVASTPTPTLFQEEDYITSSNSSQLLKVSSLVLFLALMLVSVALLYFLRKKKPQYQSQLQVIQMTGSNDNDYIYINFKDFQYDQKWEFPRENLELGKELGSGAFGMVLQATAHGICNPGISLQVAVKMLKGPTYLIFQYCHNGDLLNYLKNNRELYHKSLTEAFTRDRFSRLYHNLPKRSSTGGQESIALFSLTSSPMDTSDGPGIYEKLQGEEEEEALTYDDLLSFSYQVAKGMDFLSSKHCIHRDLAARNVLVSQGGLVKIGDFGLARDVHNDSNYVVRGNVRLPVKWMAPESIFQGMYTMQSDVWAYGILLWEVFSLGLTPYPGIKVDNNFYVMIERGFKMEQPYYASESVYKMMCKCWALEPRGRPHFATLVAFMGDQLADIEEKLYRNILDKSSNDSLYQNAPVNSDLSDLAKENGVLLTQSQNQHCKTHSTGEAPTTKITPSDMDAMEADDDTPL
nr:receptor-type tyrosine-protein kinase FLT3-like isoform X2 [Oncorhynchus gorbuscha]